MDASRARGRGACSGAWRRRRSRRGHRAGRRKLGRRKLCRPYESNWPGVEFGIDPARHWVVEDPRGQTLEATFVAKPVPPNPECLAAARAGVERLPYKIETRGLRSQNTLIGTVRGSLGETFRFYLFVNRGAPRHLGGVPGFELRDLRGGKLANTDELWSTAPGRRWTKGQKRERARILGAVGDTVCVRQTGAACPG